MCKKSYPHCGQTPVESRHLRVEKRVAKKEKNPAKIYKSTERGGLLGERRGRIEEKNLFLPRKKRSVGLNKVFYW